MIRADFVTEVRQLIASHVGDCKGEGRDINVLFYLLPPFRKFRKLPQSKSSDFLFCSLSGDGDMAVSNNVGSNTFDVLLCLGVPWLIKAAVWNAPIEVSSRGLFVSCFFIVVSVAIAFFVLYLNNWVLNQKVGCLFVVIYFIFLGTSVSMEMFVFGRFRLPMCSIEVWIFFFDNHFHFVFKSFISRLWSWKRFGEQADKINFAIPWAGKVVATSFPGRFSSVWLGTSRSPGEEVKGALSRQSSSFCLILPVTRPQ